MGWIDRQRAIIPRDCDWRRPVSRKMCFLGPCTECAQRQHVVKPGHYVQVHDSNLCVR